MLQNIRRFFKRILGLTKNEPLVVPEDFVELTDKEKKEIKG